MPRTPGAHPPRVRRTDSSTRWLRRQQRDPYVAEARRRGYRSRAAFKLAEIDDRCRLLKPGCVVVDLGAAPGGWSQIAVERVRAGQDRGGRVVAVDLDSMPPVPGAEALVLDVDSAAAVDALRGFLAGGADIVLSDMAPRASGHRGTDAMRAERLADAAADVALAVLRPGGAFVAKVMRSGAESSLLVRLKTHFLSVRHVKPRASRADSSETYVVAVGFRPPAGEPG